MQIEPPEFAIDLGLSQGLAVGMSVKLHRTMKVRHPVTGKSMLDRFPIGASEAQEVVDKMAILRPEVSLAKWLRVGDRVEIVLPELAPVAVGPPSKAPAKKAPAFDDPEPVACPACPVCPPPAVGGTAPGPVAADVAAACETFRTCLEL